MDALQLSSLFFRNAALRGDGGDGVSDPLPLNELLQALKNWIYADKQGELSGLSKNQKPLSELELELSRIKRELAEVRMERDFVKKCAAYFAKESQ